MTPDHQQILIQINDSPERKRIQELLKHAGYKCIVSRQTDLAEQNNRAIRLAVTSISSELKTDFHKHSLVLIDRFEELRSDISENITVNWIKRPFSDEELLSQVQRSLQIQKEQSAHIRRKRRLERVTKRLEGFAITDPLTGLYNLRYFKSQLQKEVQRAKRYSTPVSLVMIDLDRFKAINDQYGHLFGNEILRKIGDILQQHLRSLDIPVRYGGDEFAVILPNTKKKSARAVAEKLNEHVLHAGKKWALPQSIQLSFGIAEAPADTIDDTEIVVLADEALYQKKQV